MNNCTYTNRPTAARALAANTHDVAVSAPFNGFSDGAPDATQAEMEPTSDLMSSPVTQGQGPVATPEEAVTTAIALLTQDFAVRLAKERAAGFADSDSQAGLAVLCAREAVATLGKDLHCMPDKTRSALLSQFTTEPECHGPDHFWSVLTTLLSLYFADFSDTGWEPCVGLLPEFFADSMAVWLTDDDTVVCDLLTPLDMSGDDDAISEDVSEALNAGLDEYGDLLVGIRVIAPLDYFLARFYHPDGSWESLFHNPNAIDDYEW